MIAKLLMGWLFVIWGMFTFLCALYELIAIDFAPSQQGIGFMIISQLGVIIIGIGLYFVMNE